MIGYTPYILVALLAVIAFGIFWAARGRTKDMGELGGFHKEDIVAHRGMSKRIALTNGKIVRLTVRVEELEDKKR